MKNEQLYAECLKVVFSKISIEVRQRKKILEKYQNSFKHLEAQF